MRWDPSRAEKPPIGWVPASFRTAVGRGMRNRCPYCGEGRVFAGYLRVVEACPECQAPLGRLRADDAPPYITIFLVGHLLLPGVLMVERAYVPPMWLHMAVWLPLFTALCILVLRPIKGGVVGWMSTLGLVDDAPEAPAPRLTPDA